MTIPGPSKKRPIEYRLIFIDSSFLVQTPVDMILNKK